MSSSNLPASQHAGDAYPDLYEAGIPELQDGLANGRFTSVDLVKAYLARVDEVNLKGPALRAVIETNPSALAQAADLDRERKEKGSRGPLHGIPILLKDNIATLHSEGMNTTAGSYALLGSVVPRDAAVAAKLRTAGAILLGKTNMSEWANFRGQVPSGFSGRGGQCTCPYYPLVDPSGSSSGSGVAAAIGLAAGTLGTETDGSITSPGSRNNVVGVKPTVGLTSRAGVIPISSHQDSVGPMTRTVTDAAILLSAIAGPDPRDTYTLAQPEPMPDYTAALRADALKGVRLGVPRSFAARPNEEAEPQAHIVRAFDAALEVIRGLGAEVVDPAEFPHAEAVKAGRDDELYVMTVDLKVDLNKYLAELVEVPTGVRDLADLIKFNEEHAEQELPAPYWTDQSRFIQAQSLEADEKYEKMVDANYELGRARGIDATLQKYNLDAIVLPTHGKVQCTHRPMLHIVPLGFQPDDLEPAAAEPVRKHGPGVPFGLAFMGTAWSEAKLLGYAYAFEQATQARLMRRAYEEAVPKTQLADVVGR
ncbi:amidase signature enzyme [Gloeophyllum trabeum ATCC 11539]|uniref:Amidase signature enzyme n=1 Tax=Gloeophyllum trabeum (strain ATCC 11539 / FP-39264 / Madison 617) TaxID=670483 RepID=S7PTQ7_GLOTA|nr:amidase signature enzyme [Gloeophyllum trabeum ATCC 11539]EPQ50833.1 amidase signature enzyme [Gloeophyllum trabeum ATCC 11539]